MLVTGVCTPVVFSITAVPASTMQSLLSPTAAQAGLSRTRGLLVGESLVTSDLLMATHAESLATQLFLFDDYLKIIFVKNHLKIFVKRFQEVKFFIQLCSINK